jgi:hypothetical protein
MKISRTLLSYAGTFGLVTLSEFAFAQAPAPAAAPIAPAPAAPAPADTDAARAAPGPEATGTVPSAPAEGAPSSTVEASTTPSTNASVELRQPPAVRPPPPPPVIEPAPVEGPATKSEPLPKKVAVAKKGWLQFGALAQAWYVFEQGDNLTKDADMNKTVDTANYFRIRRAQLKFSGAIVPDTIEYLVIADLAKALKGSKSKVVNADNLSTGYYESGQDSSTLLEFALTYKTKYADVSIGEWKSPISYEANTSSSELLLPERSYSTRYFGDNYDMGIRVEKKLPYLKYSAQLLQGSTPNTSDTNKQKDLALRLEFYPFSGLFVGGAGLISVGQRDTQKSTRDIIEVDAGYDKDGVLVRGEMLWATMGPTDKSRSDSRGMSFSAAYTIANVLQPAVRFGFLDVDETIDRANMPLYKKFNLKDDEVRSYEVGLNYLIEGKNAKVMASYGYFDFGYLDPRHQVMLAGQVAY